MSSDFINEVFDFFLKMCSGEGISCEFDRGEEPGVDIYLADIQISFKMRSLINVSPSKSAMSKNAKWNPQTNRQEVQLWEDQWIYQNEKVKSKIRSLLGITRRIHARAAKIEKIDNLTLMQFLRQNHLNVAIKGKYKYGLVYKGELVAVISFSKGRVMHRGDEQFISYELLRFCNKLNCTVVGGFSKLLQHFIKNQYPDDIMTYVDADWSNGKSLLSMGFEYVETKEPVVFWLDQSKGIREYPHIVLKKEEEINGRVPGDLDSFLNKKRYIKISNSGSYKLLLKLKKNL